MKWLAVLAALAACGHPGATAPDKRDAGAPRDAQAVELPERPLGMADLAAFGWRKRAGHAAFRSARKAEERGDWPAVVAACKAALASDPDHLDASWLYAVALAKTGQLDKVVEPLAIAVAGDFGKWATPSLEHPALQAFLATPAGQAWRRRVDRDRPAYLAALARALVVEAGGDLYAFDGDTSRWFRLTRTVGGVVGALAAPAAHRIAYVSRERVKHETHTAIGIVDLATGHTTKASDVAACTARLELGYSDNKSPGFWIDPCDPPARWSQLDDDGKLHALPAKTARPAGAWLEIAKRIPRAHRLPAPGVTADWDEQGLASAIKLASSGRVVSAPKGLIDGNTATWSPDRAHLAFVAQLDDHCKPGAVSAAAYVVDATTGTAQEVERAASGLALEWVAERKLAIAGDRGVSIVELGNTAPTPLPGASDLVSPRRKPKCLPEPADEPASDDDEPDSGAPTTTDATLPH